MPHMLEFSVTALPTLPSTVRWDVDAMMEALKGRKALTRRQFVESVEAESAVLLSKMKEHPLTQACDKSWNLLSDTIVEKGKEFFQRQHRPPWYADICKEKWQHIRKRKELKVKRSSLNEVDDEDLILELSIKIAAMSLTLKKARRRDMRVLRKSLVWELR